MSEHETKTEILKTTLAVLEFKRISLNENSRGRVARVEIITMGVSVCESGWETRPGWTWVLAALQKCVCVWGCHGVSMSSVLQLRLLEPLSRHPEPLTNILRARVKNPGRNQDWQRGETDAWRSHPQQLCASAFWRHVFDVCLHDTQVHVCRNAAAPQGTQHHSLAFYARLSHTCITVSMPVLCAFTSRSTACACLRLCRRHSPSLTWPVLQTACSKTEK